MIKRLLLELSIRNINRRKLRFLLIFIPIFILTFIFTYLLATSKILLYSLNELSLKIGQADLVVVPMGSLIENEDFLLEGNLRPFKMDPIFYEKIKEEFKDEIDKITYQIYLGEINGIPIVAIDPKTDFVIYPLLEKKVKLKEFEAYAGSEVYNMLKDKYVEIYSKKFKIVSKLRETGSGLDKAIFIRVDDVKKLKPINYISVIYIKAKGGVDPEILGYKIENVFIQVDTAHLTKMGIKVKKSLEDLNNILKLMFLISIVLCILLIYNIYSIMINERRKEFGILKGLGASNLDILKILFLEGFIVCLPASFLGSISAIILSYITLIELFKLAFITIPIYILIFIPISLIISISIIYLGIYITFSKIKKQDVLSLLKAL